MLTLAFGISSLVLSIIALFVPVFGVFLSGLSGIFAWVSIGRAAFLGLAAVIINLCNIIFLSPIFLSLIDINSVKQLSNQNQEFKYWVIVLVIQLIAIFIFLFNAVLFGLMQRRNADKKYRKSEGVRNLQDHSIEAGVRDDVSVPGKASPLTKVLIQKTYGNRKVAKSFWLDSNRGHNPSKENIGGHKKAQNVVFVVGVVVLICTLSVVGSYHLFVKKDPYVPLNRVYERPNTPEILEEPRPVPKQPSNEGRYFPETNIRSKDSNQSRPIERIYSYVDSEGKTQYTNTTPPDNSTDVKLHPDLTNIEMITPVEISGNEIYVPVTIIHRGNEINTSMLLDPSSVHTILPGRNADFVKADHLHTEQYQISKDDQIVQEVRKLDIFKVGPHEYHKFLIVTQSGKGAIQRGVLGADFLTMYPYTIDKEKSIIVWF